MRAVGLKVLIVGSVCVALLIAIGVGFRLYYRRSRAHVYVMERLDDALDDVIWRRDDTEPDARAMDC